MMPKIRIRIFLFVFFFFAGFMPLWSQNALELCALGQTALDEGDYLSSLDFFRQALEQNPFYVDALKGCSESCFFLQEYREALAYGQKALKGASERVDILSLCGRIYLGLNRMEEGAALFKKALRLEPHSREAACGLAEIAVFEGNYPQGIKLFEESLFLNPNNRRALLSLALINEETENYKQAEYFLNLALEAYPRNTNVLHTAITYEMRRGRWLKAEQLSLEWQALEPENPDILILAGLIYGETERYEKAQACFKKALQYKQEDPLLWYYLGQIAAAMGDYDKALLCFRSVEMLNPGDEMTRIVLENLLMKHFPIGHEERKEAGKKRFAQGLKYKKEYLFDKAFAEFRRGRLLSPLNLDLWWAYARIQKDLNFPWRYRQEMEALYREGFRNETFLDEMEMLLSHEDVSLRARWTEPLIPPSPGLSLSLYLDGNSTSLIHSGAQEGILHYFEYEIIQDSHYSIEESRVVAGESEASSRSLMGNPDYYVLISLHELERSIRMSLSIFLSRTAVKIKEFSILCSGNGRVNTLLERGAEQILGFLPVKARLLGVNGDLGLVNLGSFDHLTKESQVLLLRQGKARWDSVPPYLQYSPEDILGRLKIREIQENFSLVDIERASSFDMVNSGDDVFVIEKETEFPKIPEQSINEELRKQLLRLN